MQVISDFMINFNMSKKLKQKITFVIFIFCFFSLVSLTSRMNARDDEWRNSSLAFIKQVNTLGMTLKPGGSGLIYIPPTKADCLILLPYASTREEIADGLRGQHLENIDDLLSLSRDNNTSPALIWLKNGRIVSINSAKFSVGVNLKMRYWKLDQYKNIQIKKERWSPNSFLSINFLGEDTN
jgi:hypothetical protein